MATISQGDIITAPQTLTGVWADLGLPIETLNYSFFSPYIVLDINDSKDVRIRARAVYESGGDDFIVPLQTIKKDRILLSDYFFEIDVDVDQNIIAPFEIDQTFPLVQIQVMAGTVGAVPGEITSAKYVQGYRQ